MAKPDGRCGLELAGLGDDDGGRRTLSNRGGCAWGSRGEDEMGGCRLGRAGLARTVKLKVCAAVTAAQARLPSASGCRRCYVAAAVVCRGSTLSTCPRVSEVNVVRRTGGCLATRCSLECCSETLTTWVADTDSGGSGYWTHVEGTRSDGGRLEAMGPCLACRLSCLSGWSCWS